MSIPALPPKNNVDWYPWATGIDADARANDTPPKNQALSLDADTETALLWTIFDDGTDTATWPNRGGVIYHPVSGDAVATFQWNEYGEVRIIPAKTNTVGFRVFVKQFGNSAAHSAAVPVIEVMNDRDNRVSLFSVMPDGTVVAPNIGLKIQSTILNAGQAPPSAGVWLRRTT